MHMGSEDHRTLMVAGASAGLAAVFSSPAVGALYGIEVPFKRDADVPRLIPSTIAACCGYAVRAALIGSDHLVSVQGSPRLDPTFLFACLVVAVCAGLGARLFAWVEGWLHQTGHRQSPLQRALLGGLILAGLAWAGHSLTGAWITFGPGYLAADWLGSKSHPLWLLGLAMLIRTCGTLTCVYGGGGGGVFTSLACNGAFVGQIVAELVGRTESRVLPLIGAACFLGAGYRIPLACMLFLAEQSGDLAVSIVGLFAIGLSQSLMGEDSVSDAQKDVRTE
jgi:CIC family chloride channel protein